MALICPVCDADNREGANFCRNCGGRLSAADRVPPRRPVLPTANGPPPHRPSCVPRPFPRRCSILPSRSAHRRPRPVAGGPSRHHLLRPRMKRP
ncbi:zinc ribbon domain-containing protein [Variovorax boronicumulans]|uniref:zinc ribbon domain-containing protein n=1 Tax=Variovorax boronicumulans TaxID=436515 RepID=UPI003B97681C